LAHYTYASRRKIEIIRQIAEGGFSVVYSAKDCVDSLRNTNDNLITTASLGGRRSFALKQIICHDEGVTRKCREEAALHRTFHHPNLMPILACKFDRNATYGEFNGMICYMLFPLYESSLRDQINKRNLLSTSTSLEPIHPWSEREIIEIFAGIVDGVKTIHNQGYAHRDVKLENVLLDYRNKPVLMDFGSVSPVKMPINTRSALMALFDDASINCTMSYRAPELFEGGARFGEPEIDGRIDVWSLGCVLFGMMFGASPFECEFRGDTVKIVECSYLRVLGNVPTPAPGTKLSSLYHADLLETVKWMLNQDRVTRPTIEKVSRRVDELLIQFNGKRLWLESARMSPMDIDSFEQSDVEFDALLRARDSAV